MMPKWIVALVTVVLVFFGAQMVSAQQQKTYKMHKKCWKRTWATSEALRGRSTMAICYELEKLLNASCQSPHELVRGLKLPADTKFKKPEWQLLDWRQNWDTIKDLVKIPEDPKEAAKWQRKEQRIRESFEAGIRHLLVTSVDIDNDGVNETVMNIDFLGTKDELPGGHFRVINPQTKRLDHSYENAVLYVNSREGGQLLIYAKTTYMIGWIDVWKLLMVYEGFYIHATNGRGSQNVCQFEYVGRNDEKRTIQ